MHQTFNIQATRDIPAGEEVSINYLPEHGQVREQRVAKLEEGYGFTCKCPACNIDTKEGQEVEERRKDMQRIIKKTKALFADSTSPTETTSAGYGADGMQETLPNILSSEEQQQVDALRVMPDKDRQIWLRNRELEVLNAMIAMYQAEGIVGREVASIYYHVAILQQSTGSYEAAVATADAGLKLEESCLGTDHPAYSEALTFVESIKKMPLAAARFR
ncbi:hypothetical protein SLS60_000780 [Paraconiothyrium brasiliense]|uniref:SET domain-containing protein n=1 Tax=Paraconiothyrium brasiliense TaxID=300254 RepID=A0ABR3S805_9PLEO